MKINKIEFEKANIRNADIVPACDISNKGFLPYLSLRFPRIGANTNVNIAFTLINNPTIMGLTLNELMKDGRNGRIK